MRQHTYIPYSAFLLQTHTQADTNQNLMQESFWLKDLAQRIGQITQNSFY